MLLLHAQRERETLSVGVAHRMRTPGSPRIAPCDLCEPLKKHRRRKDMQREPKAQRGSSKDYASASNAGPRSDDRNSRPEGKTSPRRRGRIPTRNKPSRRTQGMPQPPPCARRRIQPTTPGQSTLSPDTHSPRRRHCDCDPLFAFSLNPEMQRIHNQRSVQCTGDRDGRQETPMGATAPSERPL